MALLLLLGPVMLVGDPRTSHSATQAFTTLRSLPSCFEPKEVRQTLSPFGCVRTGQMCQTLPPMCQKVVAAWNFFVEISCDGGTCDTAQLMWSFDNTSTNIYYQDAQSDPTRPAIPSIIMTVNQVG
jgi:hypothetical protein